MASDCCELQYSTLHVNKETTHDVVIIGARQISSQEYGYVFATFDRGVQITLEWSCDARYITPNPRAQLHVSWYHLLDNA